MLKQKIILICVLLVGETFPHSFGQEQIIYRDKRTGTGERIFIHTDREEYLAGENFWFSAFTFDRQDNNRPGISGTGYIELLNSDHNPVIQKRILLTNGTGHGTFQLPDTLSPGTYILRAYTNLILNLPPGNCFRKVISIYNSLTSKDFLKIIYAGEPVLEKRPADPAISVKSSDLFSRREKITLEIEIDKDLVASPEYANLSISVSSKSGNDNFNGPEDYLYLYANPAEPDDIRFSPEVTSHFLYGRLIPQKAGAVIGNQLMLLSVPGKEAIFQYSLTDREGNFRFMIDTDAIPDEIIIQQKDNESGNLIRMGSPFTDNFPEYRKITDTLLSDIPGHIAEWSVNHQVSKIYGMSSTGKPTADSSFRPKSARFYGIPDMELRMADYILLPNMQEVFFELIPGVSMRTGRVRPGITVTSLVDNRPYESDATLMIDGVVIGDPAVIAGMNPELVERIDILRSEYTVGGYRFYGIVNVITKSGNYASFPLPDYAVRFPYRIFDPDVPFVSPDYSETEAKQSRVPDFRNTLYWNPSVKPGKDGKARVEFWSSDYVSDYEINVHGISSEGIPLSASKTIRVE
ncbi:MAG: hypothetical protein K0B05_02815 [Bacteroidales bacterium]|nr:hypothetical protein [Bacteroidales bacterium]